MPVEIDIDHVARLARVELTDDEKAIMRDQLVVVLDHAAKVSQVATGDVEPTASPVPQVNVFREDVAEPSVSHDAALSNAPAERDGRFWVPRIAETGS